jgi:hypothetical protein
MRRQNCTFIFVLAVLFLGILSAPVYAVEEKPAETQVAAQQDDWEFILTVYGWAAELDFTLPTGDEAEITFSDILDNLDMTLMTTLGARKDKWTFATDVLHLNIKDTSSTNAGSHLKLSDLYMKAWVVSPFVSYEIMGGKKGSLQLLAGARYLWIEVGLDLETRPPLPLIKTDDDGDGDVWDGIVGVRGFYNLTDRWYMPYRLDFGTGDSDSVWHAVAEIGYRFDTFRMAATYRYAEWNFGNDSALDDLTIKGPLVGAIFTF